MAASDEDYFDHWMHTKIGGLGFWCSRHPWRPWHEIWYADYWTVDKPENLTYHPKPSPLWISGDGREMILIWSDAMRNEIWVAKWYLLNE